MARFYVLDTAWDDSNVGTATSFKNDFDNHWGPSSPQYQWLANDLATHPRAVRFAFWHYPFDSDSSESGPDTFLQGANSLEGLLDLYDVTAGFNGHSHNYQRNTAPAGGIPTHITGGGGANLESIGATIGCSAIDAYGIGWSNTSNVGSACGAGAGTRHEGPRAPLPARERERHVGDRHADRRAGAHVRPGHLQRAGAERRPVADQDRLARPGAGRAAGHLHAHRRQRWAAGRHRACRSPTPCPPE